jgi:hypothetical protein
MYENVIRKANSNYVLTSKQRRKRRPARWATLPNNLTRGLGLFNCSFDDNKQQKIVTKSTNREFLDSKKLSSGA